MTDLFEVPEDENQIAAEVIKKPASEWLPEQYLPYTMYAIRSRALVADDGLKPVNRRILYSLFRDGVTPNSEHLKAARAAANAVAFHPHGSSSVEDALARMAQSFSLRVPLIDPYGSVGYVTGSTPAAARYWECRLSRAAMELLKELPEGAVPIGKNFDGKLDEPAQLPVRWPNNIINGTQGIAVGYASNMFSHNPDEVLKACIAVLKDPDLTVQKLLKIMPGPDLPTGGELFEIDGVKDYYETGSGRFTIRGRYRIENMARGKVRIVFYELPYQVSPGNVISKIKEMQSSRDKLKDISTVKDLTDRKNGLKLVIETKSGTNYLTILNELFKLTPVESKFSVNNTVLVDGSPVQTSMLDLLLNFVEFRRECVLNKAKFRVTKIDARIHQLKAILAALIDIDKCISIIRNADTADEAKESLMETFSIDADQADYILGMQLRRLTKADAFALNQENDELEAERTKINEMLDDKGKLDMVMEDELRATMKAISDPRRTVISGMTSEDVREAAKAGAQEARNVDKNVAVFLTRFADGRFVKTSEAFAYEKGTKKYANSPVVEQIKVKSQDSIVLVGSDGIGRMIPLNYITLDMVSHASDAGVQLPKGVKLVALAKAVPLKTDVGLVLATKQGDVKLVKPDFPQKEEFPVFALAKGDELVGGRWLGRTLTGSSFVSITSGGNILVYDATSLRATGAAAGGVKSHRLRADEEVIFFGWVASAKDADTFVVSQSQLTVKLTPINDIPPKSKGAQGVALHKFKKGESTLVKAAAGKDLVLALEGAGNAIPLPLVSRRAATGVDFTIKSEMGASEALPM